MSDFPSDRAKPGLWYKGTGLSFALLASCFAAWGLAQDLTTPLVAGFRSVFTMSTFAASFVQFAFYGAYFLLAVPAALINQRWGYKVGVLTGIVLAAVGAFLFLPAANSLTFSFFLIALFVMAAGLSILETSASPFVMAMGSEETSTRRLNLAQSFNPIGTNLGVLIAATLILPRMNPATDEQRNAMPLDALHAIQKSELLAIMGPYLAFAGLLLLIGLSIFFLRTPHLRDATPQKSTASGSTMAALRRLLANRHYSLGVGAQFAYVGAQVCTWTFIVIYVEKLVPGGDKVQGAWFLQLGLIGYGIMRFVMTWLMGYFRPAALMAAMAVTAIGLSLYALFYPGIWGAWALVGVSSSMCLMFPTIYGIALHGLNADTKLGASGLVMAIIGGAVFPGMQGYMTDLYGSAMALIVPTLCFLIVLAYAAFDLKSSRTYGAEEKKAG
ncbi:L-fucose:H+ symporter permease [Asaia astilbis]